jgi:hypothetical protein
MSVQEAPQAANLVGRHLPAAMSEEPADHDVKAGRLGTRKVRKVKKAAEAEDNGPSGSARPQEAQGGRIVAAVSPQRHATNYCDSLEREQSYEDL